MNTMADLNDKTASQSFISESEINLLNETIQRYQELYDKDSNSKVFAPLAEAYRKSGRLEHAYSIAFKGVHEHPNFASGLVTLARILIDQNKQDLAIAYLKTAVEMAPDNFLAHKLLGESYIQLRKPSLALQVFKMALYLDPMDEFAKKMVKKLESLTASEFTDDVFKNVNVSDLEKSVLNNSNLTSQRKFSLTGPLSDRYISLIDAYISRNDYDRAQSTLQEALDKLGQTPELQRRRLFLKQRFADSSKDLNEIDTKANLQLKILNKLLTQIEERRLS